MTFSPVGLVGNQPKASKLAIGKRFKNKTMKGDHVKTYDPITHETANALKAEFHDQLRKITYDLGGSLADLVEDLLSAAIRRTNEKAGE